MTQMQAADKKRPREEKDTLVRLRPFAKLQTAEDFEVFVADLMCTSFRSRSARTVIDHLCLDESILRKRIQELQHYRRMGLTTAADIEKYEADVIKRVRQIFIAQLFLAHAVNQTQLKQNVSRDFYPSDRLHSRPPGRGSSERELTPKVGGPPSAVTGTGPPGRKMRTLILLIRSCSVC